VRSGVPLDIALDRQLAPLGDADRRLAHEIAAGVLRSADALDARMAPFIARGVASVGSPLIDILRVGTYQIDRLDRIPPHAAVSTTVALARAMVGDHVAGFANAVMRRVADSRHLGARDAGATVSDDASSHPPWLVARWRERFGPESTDDLLRSNNRRPALVLQPTRGTVAELEQQFAEHGIRSESAPFGAGLVVHQGHPERLPGYDHGDFYVQDPAHALVVRYAAFPRDAIVYDACAAPGGKTLGLSYRTGQVIAADQSRRRLVRVVENVARAGQDTEHVIAADAAFPPIRRVAAYLLDAPCLGTGTFARHPDARLRVSAAALTELAAMQSVLLDAASDRIAAGGLLCYATCSLEPEENEMQVDAFLVRHPTFRRRPPSNFPAELMTPAGDLYTLPQRDGIDGAYAARLEQTG
jgi:16S rRNA (cytosine967-C5)-methyltransferase